MSFCNKCGATIDAESNFCPECGSPARRAAGDTSTPIIPAPERSTGTTANSPAIDPAAVLQSATASVIQSVDSVSEAIQKAHVLEELSKVLLNPAFFVMAYTIFMIPTYFLPYLGSNSSVINSLGAAAGAGLNPFLYIHFAALAILVLISWLRGKLINKAWLGALPFAALMFDLLPGLSMIPLVPTVLHVVTIVLGVMNDAKK